MKEITDRQKIEVIGVIVGRRSPNRWSGFAPITKDDSGQSLQSSERIITGARDF